MIELSIILILLSTNCSRNFSIERTTLLKAILPFLVIASHFCPSYWLDDNIRLLGCFSVSIFFFISGYGLYAKEKQGGVLSFVYLIRKILKLIIPLATFLVVYYFVYYFIVGHFPEENILSCLRENYIIEPMTWFVVTMIYLNILFFIASKISDKYVLYIITFFVFVLMLFQKFHQIQGTFYMSDMSFVAGALFNKYEHKLAALKRKIVIPCYMSFVAFLFLHLKGTIYLTMFFLPIFFILLFNTLIYRKNRCVELFSKSSYELYLFQSVSAMLIFKYFPQFDIMSFIYVVLLSVFLSVIAHHINSFIIKTVRLN